MLPDSEWVSTDKDRWELVRDGVNTGIYVMILPTDPKMREEFRINQRYSIEEGDKRGFNITMFAFANNRRSAQRVAKRHMKQHPHARYRHTRSRTVGRR